MKPCYGISKGGESPADLPVAPFVHPYPPLRIVIIGHAFYLELAPAIRKRYAIVADHLSVQGLQRLIEGHFVYLLFLSAGMC
jgi:hypothetical protein